jgi:hypothetical protein
MRNYMALFELIAAFQIQQFHLYSVLSSTFYIHSFNILSDDRFKASSKTIPPRSAI